MIVDIADQKRKKNVLHMLRVHIPRVHKLLECFMKCSMRRLPLIKTMDSKLTVTHLTHNEHTFDTKILQLQALV